MEDQTLNPFRAPRAAGTTARLQPVLDAVVLSPARWSRELPICLALVAIILVAYWGVWHYDFVYFDDPGYVTDNLDVIRGLPLFNNPHKMWTERRIFNNPAQFWTSVSWSFTAFVQSNWHPLTWLSHMLDVQLYELNAGGHHVTNIILHSLNTLLLFWLLRTLTGQSWPSAAVAALFAVHPMHVESVVWVAERKDVLSTFLGLVTLLLYVRYSRTADWNIDSLVLIGVLAVFTWLLVPPCVLSFQSDRPETFPAYLLLVYVPIFIGVVVYAVLTGRYNLLAYCGIFILFAVGLLAKPMLVTLPCLCLLLDFWPLRRFDTVPMAPVERASIERIAPRRGLSEISACRRGKWRRRCNAAERGRPSNRSHSLCWRNCLSWPSPSPRASSRAMPRPMAVRWPPPRNCR